MMAHLLDTNIWIDLDWRKIPRDSFPGLWQKVEGAVDVDQVFVLDMVYEELQATKKDEDRLAKWIAEKKKKKPTFIIDCTSEIQQIAIELINKYKLQSNADPFLVAAAKKHGLTVVCGERKMKPTEKPRIPNLCDELVVPCVTLLEYIKANSWVF